MGKIPCNENFYSIGGSRGYVKCIFRILFWYASPFNNFLR